MSRSTSKKDQISLSNMENNSQSHISNQEKSISHQSPSKSHMEEPSSLRNWHNTASQGYLRKSEMSENQEEEKRNNDIRSMRSPSLHNFNLVNQRKLNRPKVKKINQKIAKLIPKYDQMIKGVGIVRWKIMKQIKSRSVPGSSKSKSEYPVIDEGFAKELNKKLNVQQDNQSMQFKLGSVYSSEQGKKILKFLNENAIRNVNNHSLLNYAMVIDEPDYE